MKAHIARNQNAGVPMVLAWGLGPGDRGILDGMADAFGMKVRPVGPDEAGQTVAQLLGEVPVAAGRTLRLAPGAYPPAVVLANFRPRDAATLLDLLDSAKARITLRAAVTPASRQWVFGDLLAQLAAVAAEEGRVSAP